MSENNVKNTDAKLIKKNSIATAKNDSLSSASKYQITVKLILYSKRPK